MVPFAGFEMPIQYSGIRAEHEATRTAVGLFDVSHMGEIRVRGPKAEDALQWLCSNAIRRIQVGQAQYNALCNERGGIVDDVFVYKLAADDFLVCVNAANRAKDWAWMTTHDTHGADWSDEGDDWAQLAIQGPRGFAVTQALCPADLSGLRKNRFVEAEFAGVPGCVVARTGYTGEDGFEVFLPVAHEATGAAWQAVLEAGAAHGIQPVGLGARDTLRLEVRNALYGQELTDDTSPIQAGLGWITKLAKPGGFVGSEAIAARKHTDTQVLVGLEITKRIARTGHDVLHDGAVVGQVTSGTRSPSLGRSIALAYVPRALSEPGTELQVDVRGKTDTAVVVDGPFYRPHGRADMSDIPANLRYTDHDEWIRVEDNLVVIGITDHAQDALGELVHVELPDTGDRVAAGDAVCEVESVKAVAEVFTPVAGTVVAVNEDLEDDAAVINEDPYGTWLVKLEASDLGPIEALLDEAGYAAKLAGT